MLPEASSARSHQYKRLPCWEEAWDCLLRRRVALKGAFLKLCHAGHDIMVDAVEDVIGEKALCLRPRKCSVREAYAQGI